MSESEVATSNLNIPDQLYVGVKGGKPFDTVDPQLAFATQTGDGFAKRKETVDQWMGPRYIQQPVRGANGLLERDERGITKYERVDQGELIGQYVDNVPLSGFRFEKSVSRWSTSNKWFTINDPRGFQLQIAADNLGDILLNSGVLNGELQGEYVWARHKSNIFLCRTSHPAYKLKADPKVTRTDLHLGDIVLLGQEKEEYEFMGTYYSIRVGAFYAYANVVTGEIYKSQFKPDYNQLYGGYGYGSKPEVRNEGFLGYVEDPKLLWVFKTSTGTMKVLRSKPKNIKIIRENAATETIKVGKAYSVWSNLPASQAALFFDNVEDMKATKLDEAGYKEIWNQANGADFRSYRKSYRWAGNHEQYT